MEVYPALRACIASSKLLPWSRCIATGTEDVYKRQEFALLIGSMSACCAMGETTSVGATGGFIIGGVIYLVNEATGRKIMRMAIGPIAAIATGLLLNLTYLIGLTPLV